MISFLTRRNRCFPLKTRKLYSISSSRSVNQKLNRAEVKLGVLNVYNGLKYVLKGHHRIKNIIQRFNWKTDTTTPPLEECLIPDKRNSKMLKIIFRSVLVPLYHMFHVNRGKQSCFVSTFVMRTSK